jgi:hypothetical protein
MEHANRLRTGVLWVTLLVSVVQCWWCDGTQAQSVQSAQRIAIGLVGPSPQIGQVMYTTGHRVRIKTQEQQSFGPLTPLIGAWTGTGIDTVPDGKGGSTRTPFIQQVTLEAIPLLTYGSQTVRALRYSCLDWAIDDKSKPAAMLPVFEENGYFIWIPEKNSVVLQVSNPRGLSILAGGRPKPDGSFTVTTQGSDGGVLVTGYLRPFANVVGYETSVELLNSETFRYSNDTLLKLPDGSIFHQTDVTTLKRY